MGSRILLADDSITIQKVVNLTFADEGIEVVAVSSGDLAERRLPEINPDLVLADIFMPGKNGYELCESIKQNSQFRNVPVVLLVGAFEPFDQVEARRVQADAHLTKPFESRTLVETVRRLISSTPSSNIGPIVASASEEQPEQPLPVSPAMPLNAAPPKLDFAAMMAEPEVHPGSVQPRNTGELASPASEPQVFDLGVVDMPVQEAVKANLTDTSERFEPLESGEFASAEMGSRLGIDPRDMILDFDKEEPADLSASHPAASFEPESSPFMDMDGGVGETADWFRREDFGTTKLEMPASNPWQEPATVSQPQPEASDFRGQTDSPFGTSEAASETSGSTMLAVEEPLGDILLGECVSSEPSSLFNDPLRTVLTEPLADETAPETATQFDLINLVEDVPSDALPEAAQERATVEPASITADLPRTEAEASPIAETFVDGAKTDAEAGFPTEATSDQVVHDFDWTSPDPGAYSTAQLESVMMPIDAEASPSESSAGNGTQHSEDSQGVSFSTGPTWTEGEPRFAPIDGEAESLEDLSQSADPATTVETGFSFSSVTAELPDVHAANAAVPTASEVSTTSPVSSAAIEEIVRRVVAEMSESVVREVAWEVVPDCVERVIDQLTRESLSKRA
ncbi:MAG: response regulator [Blastocatellia bacterium]